MSFLTQPLLPSAGHRKTLLAVALATGLTALISACSNSENAAPQGGPGGAPSAMPVTVIEAQPAKVAMSIEVAGQTEGSREAEVRPQVSGILQRRLYQEGSPVKAGQPLFQIDPEPFRIAVADARAKAEQAAREANRLKGLVAAQAISQKEYDDAQSANTVAQALLQQAELNLNYSTVKAPVTGIAGRAQVSDGTLVTSGNSLLTNVVQASPLWVRFGLGDSEIAQIGGRFKKEAVRGVELILADGSTHPNKGKLNFSASQLDNRLGTLQLRAEFANTEQPLLPGEYVRVRLLFSDRDNAYLIPQKIVLQSEQGPFVFVAGANNAAEIRPVQAAEWRGTDWVITGGLKAGDKVIADNLMKLRPGAPTLPHKAGEMPAGAPVAGKAPAAKP